MSDTAMTALMKENERLRQELAGEKSRVMWLEFMEEQRKLSDEQVSEELSVLRWNMYTAQLALGIYGNMNNWRFGPPMDDSGHPEPTVWTGMDLPISVDRRLLLQPWLLAQHVLSGKDILG